LIVLGIALAATELPADDLTNSESFLCTASQATICSATGECTSEPPWNLNIPSFVQVDLGSKTLSTTEASGERRSGRAFSFVIAEEDGMASVAVARDGLSVAVFGVCTPLPVS
jgi:hypothetical protein